MPKWVCMNVQPGPLAVHEHLLLAGTDLHIRNPADVAGGAELLGGHEGPERKSRRPPDR
jgi:hypothetical protein